MLDTERNAMSDGIENETALMFHLKEKEILTVSQNENTKVSVMKTGKNLIKLKHYYGNKELTGIFKEMIDYKLF